MTTLETPSIIGVIDNDKMIRGSSSDHKSITIRTVPDTNGLDVVSMVRHLLEAGA